MTDSDSSQLERAYVTKQQRLAAHMQAMHQAHDAVALQKSTSNMFRGRKQTAGPKLDFTDLTSVIAIDVKQRIAEVEAAITYQDLVDATLTHGLMPAVVPQFTTITLGGAVSGGACEASSYKYGAVHETVTEMTVLLSNGNVITATPTNQHKDLFFALPNTFGSLGYILKLKILLVPVKPFVHMRHLHFTSVDSYMACIADIMQSQTYQQNTVDFLDGMVLAEDNLHLTIGQFTDQAPYTSNYTYMNIYYKSIAARDEDYVPVHDFIWRWDTDWVWGSKAFGMQNMVLRLLLGKFMLNSHAYWKLVNLDRRYNIAKRLAALRPAAAPKETMVQDAEVPIAKAGDYLRFFLQQFDLRPIWICPLKSYRAEQFPFSALSPKTRYINFGFWGSVTSSPDKPPHHFNRLLERSLPAYNGVKALYSTNFYTKDEFWQIFDKQKYDTLKTKYDPNHRLKSFYHKVCKEQQ